MADVATGSVVIALTLAAEFTKAQIVGTDILEDALFLACFFFFQAEDGIRDVAVTGVQTCALPILAGQVHGGLVQGIAQALWEEAVYDDSGTLVTGSFVDYLLPTAADTISFDLDHTTSPSTTNTLGTKGVGEAGTIASTPAVVNAVVDAIRHLGVNDIQMPCTPERVWRAINASGGGGADPTEESAMPHFVA